MLARLLSSDARCNIRLMRWRAPVVSTMGVAPPLTPRAPGMMIGAHVSGVTKEEISAFSRCARALIFG